MKRFIPAFAMSLLVATPAFSAMPEGDLDALLANMRLECAAGSTEGSCVDAMRGAQQTIVDARVPGDEAATDVQLARLVMEMKDIVETGDMPDTMNLPVSQLILAELSPEIQDQGSAESVNLIALSISTGDSDKIEQDVIVRALSASPT